MATSHQLFEHPRRGVVRVKHGFSWPAFFFSALWAGVKGLWWPTFWGLMALDIALWFLTGWASAARAPLLTLAGLVATVAYAVLRGRRGNQWLRNGLLRRGYAPCAPV